MSKFKLMWENNPDTAIDASTLSEITESTSEVGGILYKDIPQLMPNGTYSDSFLKLRANSRVLLKTSETRVMFFNTPGTLVSHNSEYGPDVQDNIVFLNNSKNGTNSIYAGEGTTNLLTNSGFEEGIATDSDPFPDWTVISDSNFPDNFSETNYDPPSHDGYIEYDPVYGEEYGANITLVDGGFESEKCVRMFTGAFGRTEVQRVIDLTDENDEAFPVVSISFYYKSAGEMRFNITTNGLYWKDGDWNSSTSAFYSLPATDEWTRFEVKNIKTQRVQNYAGAVLISLFSDTAGTESFIDSFQLEELSFASPYIAEGTREDSLLKYPANIIRADKGFVDLTIYPKNIKDFTLFSVPTNLTENAVELIYVNTLDQFQLRVWDTDISDYLTLATPARLSERIDNWTRIIVGWDMDEGLKIITSSSGEIAKETSTFTPHVQERILSFDIASNRETQLGNFFIDNLKINVLLKEDVNIMKDFEKVYTVVDRDIHRVFYAGEEAHLVDASLLDIEGEFEPLTNYYLWVIDNVDNDSGSIVVSKNNYKPEGVSELQEVTCFAGFRTDENGEPTISSCWDITGIDNHIYTKRFLVDGMDSNTYNFDIRTIDYAETSDVRSTIPVHFSDNLYGRHINDSVIHPEDGTHEVQYFEVNTEGWMAIDNIKVDGNQITTRNYPDSTGVVNNDLEITTVETDEPKIWIHAHEIDIDSGNRDVRLDKLRIDEQFLYTDAATDLYIKADKLDAVNDTYIISRDIHLNPTRDLKFGSNGLLANFEVNVTNDITFTAGGRNNFDLIHIDDNNLYTDEADLHIYTTNYNIDIDSGTGDIHINDIRIKDNLIYRDAGDILIETPDSVIIGKSGVDMGTVDGDLVTTETLIRSDKFTVESKEIEFTNADLGDFIKFDNLKIKQSELYTDANIPMTISASGNMTLTSDLNLYVSTPNNIEFVNTGGWFLSHVLSTFDKDVRVKDAELIFTNTNNVDAGSMFASGTDTDQRVVLEHKSGNKMSISNDGIHITGDLIIDGTQTMVNSTDTEIKDSTFVINKNGEDTPTVTGNASYEIEQPGGNAKLIFNPDAPGQAVWQLDMGTGDVYDIIYNGYGRVGDTRYRDNVNIVSTSPTGIKIENSKAVSGLELIDADTNSIGTGEAIMNVGLHMNDANGFIGNLYNNEAASVGAYMQIDTRNAEKNISWYWSNADSINNVHMGGFYKDDETTAQQLSPQANKGTFEAHWIKTNAVEVPGEGATSSTGLFLGAGAVLPDGTTLTGDEIVLSTNGGSSLKVHDNNGVSINGSGEFYSGSTNATGTTRVNYDGYFYANRVYNAVYNDLAEFFLGEDKPEAGKVYKLNKYGKLILSDKKGDKSVVGVCSDTPAFVMKQEYENKGGIAIALAGSVNTWVKTKISVGDELVSSKDGFAIKAGLIDRILNRSAIIGKAMQANDKGENRILMLVK